MSSQKLHGVRMWVTEGCNASCHFCLNANARSRSTMEVGKVQILCEYFKQNKFDKIAIMGGEPTIHPQFLQIMEIAQQNFESVYLFTNAIEENKLIQYSPRESDAIIYNFHFGNLLSEKKLLLNKLGKRVLDVVIDEHTNIDKIVSNIINVANYGISKIKVQLVINNSCNIFKYKKEIINNVNALYNEVSKIDGINLAFECNAPRCFTEGETLPPFNPNTICSPRSVLIDGSYNLRFCNLYSDTLINMFQDSNKLIPFAILKNYVSLAYSELRSKCLNKICKDCLFYNSQCNGKCHIGQTIISKDDICKATNLPWLKQ